MIDSIDIDWVTAGDIYLYQFTHILYMCMCHLNMNDAILVLQEIGMIYRHISNVFGYLNTILF